MIGSFLMISLGIIGEYLARIYEEVKGRPRYIVAESIARDTDSVGGHRRNKEQSNVSLE
jgi:hypothetical protein